MNQIEAMMKNLGLSREEAEALLEDDKAIDKGKKMDFDLTPEQEKVSKKMRGTGTKKPTVYKFDTSTKKRKENPTKRDLIAEIHKAIAAYESATNVEITNPERMIAFTVGGDNFEIVLQQKRKPKS